MNKTQFSKEKKASTMGKLELFLHEPISKPVIVVLYYALMWRSGFFLVLEKISHFVLLYNGLTILTNLTTSSPSW